MKKSIFLFLKLSLVVIIYMISTMLTGAFLTPLFGINLSSFEMSSQANTTMGLFTMALIQCIVMILLAKRVELKGKNLAIVLSTVFFVINYVLNVIESLIFMRNVLPVPLQLANVFNGLLISFIVGFSVSFLFGSNNEVIDDLKFNWSKKLILPWLGWILTWFVIYFCAGFFIPMNVEGVSEYYFSEQGAMDMSLVPIGYIMQIPRASLWILLTIILLKYLRGSWMEKSLVIGLTFACLMSSNLVMPNFLMPDIVRLAHLPEILYANLLWGIIISWKVKKHFREV